MKITDLKKTLDDVNKLYKEELFIRLGDPNSGNYNIERISSGSLGVDLTFGGGVPRGRIIEIYGPESSGKTTITLHMVAEHQAKLPELAVAFLDYEHSFDKAYAKALGVDTENLVFAQPTYAEQGLQGIDALIDTGKFSLIIVDSVAAMVPQSELTGDMETSSIGVQARIMSKAMRKLTGKANKTKTTIVFINQLREKIGVMFGSPWVTTGGNALKFYASIRAEVKRGAVNTDKEKSATGNRGKIKVVKNKTAQPYLEAEYDIEFGKGISRIGEIIDYGILAGIIVQKGSWFSYNDTKLGQGRDTVKTLLEDNIELAEELYDKIIKAQI